MSPSDRYTRTAVILHWLIAALLLVEVAQGWLMQEIPKQPPGLRRDQGPDEHCPLGDELDIGRVDRAAHSGRAQARARGTARNGAHGISSCFTTRARESGARAAAASAIALRSFSNLRQ